MDYARLPLFPKHTGAVALPFVIRETSEPYAHIHYTISVHPPKFHKDDGVDFAHIKIQREELRPYDKTQNNKTPIGDFNTISNIALKEFIFIDDGSFYHDRLKYGYYSLNRRAAESLRGETLFNVSNVYTPLKIYRLQRDFGNSCPEKPTSKKVSKTYWTMETLDHSQNVPCARFGHSTLVDCKNDYLYLFGGVTILGLKRFQGEIDDIDNNWFYYPLKDVWRMDLKSGYWTRMNDLSMKPPHMSTIPTSLDLNFKMPKLLENMELVYDYQNELIYGCYSPRKIFTRYSGGNTRIFSFDPAKNCYTLEASFTGGGATSLAIAHEYNKLFVQFYLSKHIYIYKIPSGKVSKAKHSSNGKKLSPQLVKPIQCIFTDRIKYFGHGQFTACFKFPSPLYLSLSPSNFPTCSFHLNNWTGIKNPFVLD